VNFLLDNTPNNKYTTPMTTITTFKLPTAIETPGCPVQIGYSPENGLNLNEMYGELDCDLVQAVLSPCFPGVVVWCDEEALLKCDPELNLRASIIAGQPIYGPVLIVSENRQQYSRSWSPDNPLPFMPCELDGLAKQIMAGVV
jgi:hypothetical protein